MYFDQTLLQQVEKSHPYVTNTQGWTQNNQDFLIMMGAQGDDPFMRYVMLGDKIEDGLFAWIRMGVDASSDRTVSPAAFMYADGGHQNMDGPVGDGSKVPPVPAGGFGFPGMPGSPDAPNAPAMPGMPTMPATPTKTSKREVAAEEQDE
jgi:hypothetical protein